MDKHHPVDLSWQKIYVDLLGPYYRSKTGNTMILIVLDQLTKFVLFKPLRKGIADTITSSLRYEVFHEYGVPEVLHSDNRKQFVGHQMQELLEEYGVNHMPNAVYSPQANASERVNRTILAAIRTYIKSDKDHKTWYTHLSSIAGAIRNSVHCSTTFSPYYAMFERHIDARFDISHHS